MKGEITLYRTPNKYEVDVFTRKVKNVTGIGCNFVSGDKNAYKIVFKIFDNGEPMSLTDKTVLIGFKRANRTVYVDDEVTVTNPEEGECEYIVKTDAISVPGKLLFEIYIYEGVGSRITTPSIMADVFGDIDNDTSIKATDQYPMLASIVEKTRMLAVGSFTATVVVAGMTSDLVINPFIGYGLTHWALYSDGVRISDVTPITTAIRINQALLGATAKLTVRIWNTATPPNPDAQWSEHLFEMWNTELTWGDYLDADTYQLEAALHNINIVNGSGYGLIIR